MFVRMISGKLKINVFWFRRDLRLHDNTALNAALKGDRPVLPLFIFDTNITSELKPGDARISFIYRQLQLIREELAGCGSSLLILKGTPQQAWEQVISSYDIGTVYCNKDYEPYARERDRDISRLLAGHDIAMQAFKNQVIFEENEITKSDGKPYTVFTPYKNQWLKAFYEQKPDRVQPLPNRNFIKAGFAFPDLQDLGFRQSETIVRPFDLSVVKNYHLVRDIPHLDQTSHLGPHLRFGTVSIREMANLAARENPVFLSELIWREFFMQILYHFPHVVTKNFKAKYDNVRWLNNEKDLQAWREGRTGYPMVDAGMRQLNESGYMHNRVRMITAGFLCKHLLVDWRLGEAYFAEKLLDYELSSNNGNWQWAAGTGCDAAPYFRIFNPDEQLRKFDPEAIYVTRWIPEYNRATYPAPVIEHRFARDRALQAYGRAVRD